ncbi:DNA mismatch repair protein MutT [Acetobacter aceti 1023]|nr:DNA mismatch repair protein MutT [Acetobacter aceti 1023]
MVSSTPHTIYLATALLMSPARNILLVRKQGTRFFMQPGGKRERGETAEQTLEREIQEELSLKITVDAQNYIGRFQAPAANEPHHVIEAELFQLFIQSEHVSPAAEIEQIVWIDPLTIPADLPLAPFTKETVIPLAGTLFS